MELSVQKLNLAAATEPIPEDGPDPYQSIQVHDYLSVRFFKMDPVVKAASSETIRVLSLAYPEMLAHKYFVNVPAIMGWMYAAMKLFLAPATLKKFHPMASGTSLAAELPAIAASLPKAYGGSGPEITTGETIKLAPAQPEKKAEETPVPAAPAQETKPTEESKPAEEPKPAEAPAATEESKTEAVADAKADDKPAEVKAA
jgi:phosphatidylinositol transfer protein SFH5